MAKPKPHPDQPDLPLFRPVVTFPTVTIPQADGSYLVKPGKPVVHASPDDRVSTRRAAQILGLSQRRISEMCEQGILDWERIGDHGNYRITVESIDRLRQSS